MRACRMPFAAMRPMNNSYMQGGSNAKVLTRPAINRIGVSGQSAQMRLMRSHGILAQLAHGLLDVRAREQLDRLEAGLVQVLGDRQHHAGRHPLSPQTLMAVADGGVDEVNVFHGRSLRA